MERLAVLVFLVLALQACSGESEQTPSAGTTDLPEGALGQFEFTRLQHQPPEIDDSMARVVGPRLVGAALPFLVTRAMFRRLP